MVRRVGGGGDSVLEVAVGFRGHVETRDAHQVLCVELIVKSAGYTFFADLDGCEQLSGDVLLLSPINE